jgi:periplasmic protein TonB
MIARAIPWFEDAEPRDLRRWAIAALIVLGIHCAVIAAYVFIHVPDSDIGDNSIPVVADLSPGEETMDQPEVAPTPEQPPPVEEKPQPPPPDLSPAVVAPETPPVEKVPEQQPQQPMPAMSKASAPQIDSSWESNLTRRLQHFKRYPSGAQARGEEGVVLLGFTMDRTGHVLEHQIVKSSGFPDLDAEVSSLIQRAQPLPSFPPNMTADTMAFTVPIRFSLHQQ